LTPNWKHFAPFFAVAAICVACGQEGNALLNAASSNDVTETKEYPSVALVVMPDGNGICTGTFISPRAVLTAAHCAAVAGSYGVYTAFGNYFTATKRVLGPGTVDDPSDLAILLFGYDVADPALGRVVAVGSQPRTGDEIKIVGYGCNDLDTKRGTGTKRAGTNNISTIDDYLNLLTTPSAVVRAARGTKYILGPENQAGSCNGDSGGPMLQIQDDAWKITGVTHAGGHAGSLIASQYVNLNRAANINFLQDVDTTYSLHLFDGCWTSADADACTPIGASMKIFAFLKPLFHWLANLFISL
jgi:hypothetical protein